MRIWAVANQKGGVGKTTSAVTLAGLLAARGESTLMVDLDPHGSLTGYFGIGDDPRLGGVYELFRRAVADSWTDPGGLIVQTGLPNLAVLPSSPALATLDRQLGAHKGMGLVLHRGLTALSHRFSTAILDCPPVLGVLVVNALAACERVIIPVQTEFLALKGLQRMLETLHSIEASKGKRLQRHILPTMFDRRTRACVQALRALHKDHGAFTWAGAIPVDTMFREASSLGLPLSMLYPEARGVVAYADFLAFLEGRKKERGEGFDVYATESR